MDGGFVYSDRQVIVDGDRRVQARGGGCVQEEQAAGVLQIEPDGIRFGTQDADARDAAIRVIGDCDGFGGTLSLPDSVKTVGESAFYLWHLAG